MEDYIGLVNKPPIDEIYNLDLVNKPDICDDKLMHYGVPGMKWGVRRYQNLDGTLTSAGKKRQKKEEKKKLKEIKRKQKEHKKIMTDRKKFLDNYYSLSDDDRRLADKYFDALEKMEKREMTHISKIDKKRKSRIDSLLTGPNLLKGFALGAGSVAGTVISVSKIQDWLKTENGKSIIEFVKKCMK